ncbi:MAG: spore photoproduct lyase family protein [Planctomycetota bacterium]
MDTAKTFTPKMILLWRKVAELPEARRIVDLFPSTPVKIVDHQRFVSSASSLGQSIRESKKTLMIGQTSSFINGFDGKLGPHICCRPYYKLVPVSNGCPYRCTYCYLAFVYRKHHPFIKINVNYDTMLRQIAKLADGSLHKISFNMGEMLDSLALDHVTNLSPMLVEFFSRFSNAYLMLLTKSANISNLLSVKPNNQTVVSWSINSAEAVRRYELDTADIDERIAAAKRCQNHGYRIRFRIDPGILHPNWQNAYAEMIQKMLLSTEPENITIGMLRLVPGYSRLARQTYPAETDPASPRFAEAGESLQNQHLTDLCSDGKLRYPEPQRIEFYTFLIDAIRGVNKTVPVSLCRETPHVLNTLKGKCQQLTCNCLG